jgi:hypothetical protein
MTATRFTTVNDLRNWVGASMGPDATDDQVVAVTKWIQNDTNRPDWGLADWSEYLDGLDLCHILTGLGL